MDRKQVECPFCGSSDADAILVDGVNIEFECYHCHASDTDVYRNEHGVFELPTGEWLHEIAHEANLEAAGLAAMYDHVFGPMDD